jgi:rare lipoprotein A
VRRFVPILLACTACAHVSRPAATRDEGIASWYGAEFAGRSTANGEKFDPRALTAAHRTLPFGTCLHVEMISTGRSVDVRINDRGPFVAGRLIDLSQAAAKQIGLVGLGRVRLSPCLR